ncbi:hypothetical protein M9H77_24022 [Catharanthus roseus]|uniref:Uncharacterized protein n=1 Tax=Catharanthus roseus TaxID=4058 RepID=A0ACC0AVW5_CATRO|nr:hypothetical protein M9H77_24022 [Catharanthus roseus]
MQTKKPRIVIIGAGMAGITAANKLYTCAGSKDLLEISIVEGGTRIGGRINTSEFGGDRIEMGATWIHGIKGSPIHKIAQEINSLDSEQPWECMDGFPDEPITVVEGGYELNQSLVQPVSNLFKQLMDFAQGKPVEEVNCLKLAAKSCGPGGNLSVGYFLRQGLDAYLNSSTKNQDDEHKVFDNWTQKSLEEAIFAMHENTQRTYTSAGDLHNLDYNAESEYRMFPGEEITIAKGYLSVVDSLASVLPAGTIQLGKKVTKIEWQPDDGHLPITGENGHGNQLLQPVKLHFLDGTTMSADHVIITVSLGVLKQGIRQEAGMFNPPLPNFKSEAITKLGYGVVNKLFLQLKDQVNRNGTKFPSLQLVFHQSDSKQRHPTIPWWIRRTASLCPIYGKSSVLLSWFAGEEALELETLNDQDILDGVSTTISNFLGDSSIHLRSNCNGNANSAESSSETCLKFGKILKTRWGSDPLFLGSYSYVAVGSSGDDLDSLAEPLPTKNGKSGDSNASPPLQILFAGEATHRTHYSTTHGAYFSGLREANRLLEHYKI